MNEQLQNALADLLTKTNEGIAAGADFLVAELPDVIQQLLTWYGTYNFLMFAFSFLALAIYCYIVIKSILKKDDESSVYGRIHKMADGAQFIPIGLIGIIPLPIFVIESMNLQWLKIWIAPKIWLIEYAATLAK